MMRPDLPGIFEFKAGCGILNILHVFSVVLRSHGAVTGLWFCGSFSLPSAAGAPPRRWCFSSRHIHCSAATALLFGVIQLLTDEEMSVCSRGVQGLRHPAWGGCFDDMWVRTPFVFVLMVLKWEKSCLSTVNTQDTATDFCLTQRCTNPKKCSIIWQRPPACAGGPSQAESQSCSRKKTHARGSASTR